MSALVIDTSSWVSYLAGKGHPAIDEALREARAFLPPIVAAELLSGELSRSQRMALEDLLSDLPSCATGLDHWFRVGSLRAALRRKGMGISTSDAHVAQCALDLKGELLTEDAIFRKIARVCSLRLVA